MKHRSIKFNNTLTQSNQINSKQALFLNFSIQPSMKRSLECSDSLGALTMTEEHSPTMMMMLDGIEEELMECSSTTSSKKRRLRVDQVKALEKNFEVENKLEPERKVKLAQELGLQPRQVAVWFQNRRARWKTKQLERDYALLKANYDALQLNSHTLQNHNQALRQQIKELKSRVEEEQTTTDSDVSVKEEIVTVAAESDEKVTERERRSNVVQLAVETTSSFPESECNKELNYEWLNGEGGVIPADLKDGASDSDTSAILNEDNNNNNSPNGAVSAAMNCLELSSIIYESQYGKMEEHNLFSAEEACNFFSEEQAPTLQWYC